MSFFAFYSDKLSMWLQADRLGYREVILANTLQSLSVVLDAMEMMGIGYKDSSSTKEAQVISDIGSYPEV